MRIAFVHGNKAFLPDLHAYTRFFEKFQIDFEVSTSEQLSTIKRDVEWHFMGFDFNRPDEEIVRIHEYCSSSTPPMRRLKDFTKSYFNSQPDLRIFQNEFVKSSFRFHDHVPCCFRDVGINKEWLDADTTVVRKEYDFIYCGDVSENRKPRQLLDLFTAPALREKSLLILSRDYQLLAQNYSSYSNIIFKGPVSTELVREHIKRSRFAINFIPTIKPFTELSSTKFVEYLACGVPVISTEYSWVKKFQQQYGGSYYFLNSSLSNLDWNEVNSFNYSMPDLSSWTWEQQILRSGICEFLNANFPDIQLPSENEAVAAMEI